MIGSLMMCVGAVVLLVGMLAKVQGWLHIAGAILFPAGAQR
jgi:hypothetical protein